MLLGLALLAVVQGRPFAITVVDDQTGRGVPLVELRTVHQVVHWTDSAGVVAFDEPGLMGREVFFHVRSHGYQYPADGFGFRGPTLRTEPGGSATIKVRRINIAERLYRVTGAGIYRDSLLVGRPAPIREPLLNARVLGQDSVQSAVYRGRVRWFWGDTLRPSYPLGNFHSPGATSRLPGEGGLDPARGIDLAYFTDPTGFVRGTARIPGAGPTWLTGLVVLRGGDGAERMFASYAKTDPPGVIYERGLVEWDDARDEFRKRDVFPSDAPLYPEGHAFIRDVGGVATVFFGSPFPVVRVRAEPEALRDLSRYEAFTGLVAGTRAERPRVDRDEAGRVRHGWKAMTAPGTPAMQAELFRRQLIKPGDDWLPLQDYGSGRSILPHSGSVAWNPSRGRWVAVFVEAGGDASNLGEVWFAEADTPLGPWAYARKVATHDRYSFYNLKHHPFIDQQRGRFIFFEGTYSASYSGTGEATPRYDDNQVMYRLDLADPRLNLPVPVYDISAGVVPDRFATAGPRGGRPVAFYALERPSPGTVPIYERVSHAGGRALRAGEAPRAEGGRTPQPLFYAYPLDAETLPVPTTTLNEYLHADGVRLAYSADPSWSAPGFRRTDRAVCNVWRSPTRFVVPAE